MGGKRGEREGGGEKRSKCMRQSFFSPVLSLSEGDDHPDSQSETFPATMGTAEEPPPPPPRPAAALRGVSGGGGGEMGVIPSASRARKRKWGTENC